MLIGISPCIGPDLLSILHRMGHGDEIVLGDAFFCGDTFGQRVIRADGIRIPDLLEGILALMNLDESVPDSLVIMSPADGDVLDVEMKKNIAPLLKNIGRWLHPLLRWSGFHFMSAQKKPLQW